MQTVDEILEMFRKLSAKERRRLNEEIYSLESAREAGPEEVSEEPYTALLALAGTMHSDFTDLSTNKYEHIAAAIWEHKRG